MDAAAVKYREKEREAVKEIQAGQKFQVKGGKQI